MTFRGWPVEALEFFEGLEADNSKTYWQRNKDVYETLVRAPMEELIAELEPKWGEGRIFRPYRDVRFSADKSPYKTHIAALVGDGYVQLSARGLAAGAGNWEMTSDQLEQYRKAVDEDRSGKRLVGIVAKARAAGLDVTGHGELKTAPRGYPKDHPRIELLRYKGLVAWRDWPAGAWLGTRAAKDRVLEFIRLSEPLTKWLRANVKD
jgi:TIGR02453 family protein